MKVEEQAEFITKNGIEIAVGTPNRIGKIAEAVGEDKFYENTSMVIFDAYVDQKNRSLFDIPEVRKDWQEMLKKLTEKNSKVKYSLL